MTENLFDCFFYNNQTYAKSMMALEWNFCQASETVYYYYSLSPDRYVI